MKTPAVGVGFMTTVKEFDKERLISVTGGVEVFLGGKRTKSA